MKKTVKIIVDRRVCKACGICAALCPQKALALDEDGKPYLKEDNNCVGCGLCELRCPDMALRLGGEN